MRERLEKFIKTEGLSPSRFAEIMSVQPSSISHILSGRNKPSYDFIEKFLLRFPKVNPDWLILGKNPMYRELNEILGGSTQPVDTVQSSSNPARGVGDSGVSTSGASGFMEAPSLFDKEEAISPTETFVSHSTPVERLDHEGIQQKNRDNSVSFPDDKKASVGQTSRGEQNTSGSRNSKSSRAEQPIQDAEIDSIVIFYRNNKFKTFRP